MKTNSCSVIVTALAVGTLGLLTTAEAGPLMKFSRFRHSGVDKDEIIAGFQKKARLSHPAPAAPVPAGYPHYQLIDLGTLGGPGSSTVFPARALNNRGEMIAFANTNVPDPICFGMNCYIQHGILRQPNGNIIDLPFPAGIDPTNNNSLVDDITRNGLLSGFVTNGVIDPLTDFPETRAVIWGSEWQESDRPGHSWRKRFARRGAQSARRHGGRSAQRRRGKPGLRPIHERLPAGGDTSAGIHLTGKRSSGPGDLGRQ